MRVKAASLLLPLALLLVPRSLAAEARFERVITADSSWATSERTVFRPDTARVFVLYTLVDSVRGTRLRAVWYAQKVEGIVENLRCADLSTVTGDGSRQMGNFSYSKPPRGWPAGIYRVELFINDQPAKTLTFRVEAGG